MLGQAPSGLGVAVSQAVLVCLGGSDPAQAVERAAAVLAETGQRLGPQRVVASRRLHVVEHALTGSAPIDCRSATKRLRGLQREFGVDLAVLPADAARRDKKLLVIDMDSTLVQSEGIDELAKEAGVGELFLVHISSRYKEADPIESQARAVFPKARVPKDLEEVEVPWG